MALTLWLGGQASAGGVVSRTVTVNELLLLLPEKSVAPHVTVVVPRGNVLPDAGAQLTATSPSRSSIAVGSA